MALLNPLHPPSKVLYYRSKDGTAVFKFAFTPEGDHIAVHCLDHPSLSGVDDHPSKTHLFASGRICFVAGQEPRDQNRAQELARQWAEYFVRYGRTGIAES